MIPTFEVKETGLGLGLGRVDGSVNARVRDWSRKGSPSSSQLRGSREEQSRLEKMPKAIEQKISISQSDSSDCKTMSD